MKHNRPRHDKMRMTRTLLPLLVFCLLPVFAVFASEQQWLGAWQTRDNWGSEYTIVLEQDGTAHAAYAGGIDGTWQSKDGGILILWDNKTQDFLFSGVMGRQRLFTSPFDPAASYNAGIAKKR